jgi:hypothetical protein
VSESYEQVYERLDFVPHRAPERIPRAFFDELDSGIAATVAILRWHGVETCQSCQGGPGHSYPEPTVDFVGDDGAGMRALGIATMYGLRVQALRRSWNVQNSQLFEVVWQLVFWPDLVLTTLRRRDDI